MFTPEGTLGPFYPGAFAVDAMPKDLSRVASLLAHRPHGQPIHLSGRFLDANGAPVPSLIIEVWQANAYGRYRHPCDDSGLPLDPHFDGFARIRTEDNGTYSFNTIKPGGHPLRKDSSVIRAPHLRLTIFASGIDQLGTQVFFADEPLNATDPILNSIEDCGVRERLVARGIGDGRYTLDIILRGEGETPFFDHWMF